MVALKMTQLKENFTPVDLEKIIKKAFLLVTKKEVEVGLMNNKEYYDISSKIDSSLYSPYITFIEKNPKERFDSKSFFNNNQNKLFFLC